eukprot:m.27536 g.27536  ORF g.27536 m.27536 type:complete len:66 (+) comp4432_c0_seq1:793-990(+)
MLVNNGDTTRNLTLTFGDIPHLPPAKSFTVRDLWRRADIGVFATTYSPPALAPRDSALLLLTPVA